MFSDVLLTVDYDRTFTGPDSAVPENNLEAVAYFKENGGTFTVNTGRGVATFWKYMDSFPANAPLLLYNGSAAWENGQLTQLRPIDLDVWTVMAEVRQQFPEMNLEIQGEKIHYLIDAKPDILALYDNLGWKYACAQWGQDVGVFLKFALFGTVRKPVVADMYAYSQEESRRFNEAEAWLRDRYGERWRSSVPHPGSLMFMPRVLPSWQVPGICKSGWGRKFWCVWETERMIFLCSPGQTMPFVLPTVSLQTGIPTCVPAAKGQLQRLFIKKYLKFYKNNLDTEEIIC